MSKKTLLNLIFSDWKVAKRQLLKRGFTVDESSNECAIITKDGFSVGFDWDTTDFFTRKNLIQLIMYQGFLGFDITDNDINQKIKSRGINFP